VAWPIAGVLAAGVALGPVAGALTGVLMGAARATSSILHVVPASDPWIGPLTPEQGLSLVTTAVLYAVAGGVAGHATRLLSRAEERLSRAERTVAALEAREEVARRLHDGVLQTLAIVERRAEDPELARLARDQERDLRRYLLDPGHPDDTGGAGEPARTLGAALRGVTDRFERRDAVRTEVLVPDDLPSLPPVVVEAVTDAVGEALTNVGKHARASRVVVYVEPQDGWVFVSVRDDGVGFDPAEVPEGLGLTRSVRGRLAGIGGRVEVAAAPARGVEVRLWAPVEAP
jgi:signal transduction histidine kinase